MMKMKMVALGLALLPVAAAAQQTLEFDGRTWVSASPDAKVEQFMGREALLLRNGGVFLEGVEFQNGVIEYDMATTGHRPFVGAAFRLRETPRSEYEQFYVRPHQTGRFDATQYTPEINGLAAWQLFPEFNAPVDIPSGEWISRTKLFNPLTGYSPPPTTSALARASRTRGSSSGSASAQASANAA